MISYYNMEENKVYTFIDKGIAEVSDIYEKTQEIVEGTTKVSSIDIKEFFSFDNEYLRFSHRGNWDGTVRAYADYPKYSGNSILVEYNQKNYESVSTEFIKYGFEIGEATRVSNLIGESCNTVNVIK